METQLAGLIGLTPSELRTLPPDDASDDEESTALEQTLSLENLGKLRSLVDGTLTELGAVEREAHGFQTDIQQLAAEMKQLQAQSATLHERLEVRQRVVAALGPLVESHVIPPAIVKELSSGEISAQWRAALAYVLRVDSSGPKPPSSASSALNGTSTTASASADSLAPAENANSAADRAAEENGEGLSTEQDTSEAAADRPEPQPPLESPAPASTSAAEPSTEPPSRASISTIDTDLSTESASFTAKLLSRAAQRIKDYYLARIRRLRRPGQDAEAVQDELVNNRALFVFLNRRYPRLAQGLRRAYLNTMRWYYHLLLGKYLRVIDRQPVQYADGGRYVVGKLASSAQASLFGSSSSAKAGLMFNVGTRPAVLAQPDAALSLATLTPPPQGYYIEDLLRSIVAVLTESVAAERRALALGFASVPLQDADITYLFGDLFTQARSIITRLTGDSYDIYGLLLSVQLVRKAQASSATWVEADDEDLGDGEGGSDLAGSLAAERADKTDVLTKWPEPLTEWYEQVLAHLWLCARRVLDANAESIETAAAKPSAHRDVGAGGPHPMTQPLAGLLTGALQIFPEDGAVEAPVAPELRQLSSVFEMFITKVSQSAKKGTAELFLYNNFFLVAALLGDIPGKLAAELAAHYKILTELYDPAKSK